MTKARNTGKHWTEIAGRDRGLASSLLVALPLLLLLSLMGARLGTPPAEGPGGAIGSQAADVLGAESKAQLANRGWLLGADHVRPKPKLSGDGPGASLLAGAAVLRRTVSAGSTSPVSLGMANAAVRMHAARPRAPPATV